MTHIMCDLETLDTATTACVLSIGLVAFDPNSGVINDRFYAAFPRAQQLKVGRTISDATLTWWMDQSPRHARYLTFRRSICTRRSEQSSSFSIATAETQ